MLRNVHHVMGTIARQVLPDAERPLPTVLAEKQQVIGSRRATTIPCLGQTQQLVCCATLLQYINCDSLIFADTSSGQY